MTDFIDNLPNDEYHKPERGFSSTNVKDILKDPALIQWARAAEQDNDKMPAIDFGKDFHSYFLEPDVFAKTYKVLPEFNRRIVAEKEAELATIAAWESNGITAVKAEDMQKLEAMRNSALAHPTVAAIMALNGIAERSYFWTDELTGVECKCRPDWLVLDITDKNRLPFMADDETTLAMDVKTIARIDRIQAQVEELGYFIQDAFYTDGIAQVTGTKVCFVFAFVSTSLSLGRYPVQVVMLDTFAKLDGKGKVLEALGTYAQLSIVELDCAWQTVRSVGRPHWANRDESTVDTFEDYMV